MVQAGDPVVLICDTVPGVPNIPTKGMVVTVTKSDHDGHICVDRVWVRHNGQAVRADFRFSAIHYRPFTPPTERQVKTTTEKLQRMLNELSERRD
jgi:hypothetical protein